MCWPTIGPEPANAIAADNHVWLAIKVYVCNCAPAGGLATEIDWIGKLAVTQAEEDPNRSWPLHVKDIQSLSLCRHQQIEFSIQVEICHARMLF
ncbi:MAG TPA: hypothetical protein VLE48_03050 [Terriglobales bacterium]|nr:hypothetical protein [Terriglobales bacterium]